MSTRRGERDKPNKDLIIEDAEGNPVPRTRIATARAGGPGPAAQKDSTKADGDAVNGDGTLKDAGDMEWPESATEEIPKKPKKNKDTGNLAYHPPKQSDELDDEAPEELYGSDGEELVSLTERGQEMHRRREEKNRKRKHVPAPSDSNADAPVLKSKAPKKKRKKAVRQPSGKSQDDVMEISSADESDGRSALRAVEKQEKPKGARHGPRNESMQHYYAPVAVIKKREKRWEFSCRYCESVQTVLRTVGDTASFDDEPKIPALNNLSTHLKKSCKGAQKNADEGANKGPTTSEAMHLKRS
ncbi:hypothetical protein C8J56DRAFT_68016, partial [Mycena floridula]